jgi:hypothetical protein
MNAATDKLAHDLEVLLDQLIVEHRRLLAVVQEHAGALKALDLPRIDATGRQQEACRAKIAAIEHRRRATVHQIMRLHRLSTEPTLGEIAQRHPLCAAALLGKRDVLRALAGEVALRANVSGKLAGAVLGHLNTAIRAIAGAVRHAGVYTKTGLPPSGGRIGAMEAVG